MTSMFSGMNQFTCLSELLEFTTLFGFTEREIRLTYGDYIKTMTGRDLDDVIEELRYMYNGYRFHPEQKPEDTVYNTWSVLKYLSTCELQRHWMVTGAVSSTTIDMLGGLRCKDLLDGFNMSSADLYAPIAAGQGSKNWRQLAFQSGYVTILHATKQADAYYDLQLGPPNEEVRSWLDSELRQYLVSQIDSTALQEYGRALKAFDFGAVATALTKLIKTSKAGAPENESAFSMFALGLLAHESAGSFAVRPEAGVRLEGDAPVGRLKRTNGAVLFVCNSKGKDKVEYLLVMELKYEKSTVEALKQIHENGYVTRATEYVSQTDGINVQPSNIRCVGMNYMTDADGVTVVLMASRPTSLRRATPSRAST